MNALIIGPRRIGKTTLLRRVVAELGCPVVGYATKKEEALYDPIKGNPIYLYPVQAISGRPEDRVSDPEHLVGWCLDQKPESLPEAFNRFAPQLLEPRPDGGLVVFDEVGFMEAKAEAFADAIFKRLDGPDPVLAAVKSKGGHEFLERVRKHPDSHCFYITEDNRDALVREVVDFLRPQLEL